VVLVPRRARGIVPPDWKRYRPARTPLILAYPPDWTASESAVAGRLFFRPPDGDDPISAHIIDVIHAGTATLSFEAITAPLARSLRQLVHDYRETGAVRLPDLLRIDYTGTVVLPGRGTLYFVRHGAIFCALHFFVPRSTAARHAAVLEAMLASIRLATPPETAPAPPPGDERAGDAL
jgi:hypothetical protein